MLLALSLLVKHCYRVKVLFKTTIQQESHVSLGFKKGKQEKDFKDKQIRHAYAINLFLTVTISMTYGAHR